MPAAAMPIPEILTDYRKRKKLSMGALALYLGVSKTAVNQWEHGHRNPDPEYCEVIAAKLDLPLPYVLSEAGHIAAQAFAESPEPYDVLTAEATTMARALRAIDPESYELWLSIGRKLIQATKEEPEP